MQKPLHEQQTPDQLAGLEHWRPLNRPIYDVILTAVIKKATNSDKPDRGVGRTADLQRNWVGRQGDQETFVPRQAAFRIYTFLNTDL